MLGWKELVELVARRDIKAIFFAAADLLDLHRNADIVIDLPLLISSGWH